MRRLSFIGRRVARVATQTSFILGIAMIAMLWAGIVLKFKDQSAGNYRDAVQNNQNLALLFEENVLRSVGEIDNALLYLRHQIEQQRDSVDLHTILMNTKLISEVIDQFAITDAKGILRASNRRAAPPPPINLSDREHFRVHVGAKDDGLFISKPVIGRVSGKWSIQVTRRIENPDGSFGGVVVASLDPTYLSRFYNSDDIQSDGYISVVGADGIIRAISGRARSKASSKRRIRRNQCTSTITTGEASPIDEGCHQIVEAILKSVRVGHCRRMQCDS